MKLTKGAIPRNSLQPETQPEAQLYRHADEHNTSELPNHRETLFPQKASGKLAMETEKSILSSEQQAAVSPKKYQRQPFQPCSIRVGIRGIAFVLLALSTVNIFQILNRNLDSIKENRSSDVVVPSTSTHPDQAQQSEVDKQQIVDNRAPDFGIIGYPKTGTTFLVDALDRHPEVVMPVPSGRAGNREFCELENWFQDMRNVSSPPQSPYQTPTRYGFKCPTMLRQTKGVEDLVKIAEDKDTRLVMGVRHPVLWFESFHNYRVLEWYKAGSNEQPIPSLFELTGKDKHWRDVCVKYARFDIYMKQLAKVRLTDKEMEEMLDHDNMFPKRISPNPYKIFMFTIEQINDRNDTRRMMFQEDLQTFLKLRSPLEDFASLPISNPSNSTFKERINICEEKFSPIRSQLIKQGKQASKWIINKFMEAPNVVVSNPEFIKSAIRGWGSDPCDERKKKITTTKRAANSTTR